MTSPASIIRLRRITAALVGGATLDPADAGWLGGRLASYLDRPERTTLDRELGLVGTAGQSPAWKAERRAIRDELIRYLAARCFAGLPVEQQAARIAAAAARYSSTSWPRDQHYGLPAVYDPEGERGILYRAFQASEGRFPASVKRLRTILSGGREIAEVIS